MKRSMKQRVALFLSFAMAFTSIDSSALVAAADVTESVSEEIQREDVVSEEEAQEEVAVQEEEAQVEESVEEIVEEAENAEEETLSSDMSENANDETLIGSPEEGETNEQVIEGTADTDQAQEEVSNKENEDTTQKVIASISVTSSRTKPLIAGLDVVYSDGPLMTIQYEDNETYETGLWNPSVDDPYGNTVDLYLRNTEDETQIFYAGNSELEEGTYRLECVVGDKTWITTAVYQVVSLDNAGLTAIDVGEEVRIESGVRGQNWYQFTAPKDSMYRVEKCNELLLYKKTEEGTEWVNSGTRNFHAQEGETFYLGFRGAIRNPDTEDMEYSWTTTISEVEKEIQKIDLLSAAEDLIYAACESEWIPAGLQYRITYSDHSTQDMMINDDIYMEAENGERISTWLVKENSDEPYTAGLNYDNRFGSGRYAVQFEIDGQTQSLTDYRIQVSDLKDLSKKEFIVGENQIDSNDSGKLSWYAFTPAETGIYLVNNIPELYLYNGDDETYMGCYFNRAQLELTQGITYYLGFSGTVSGASECSYSGMSQEEDTPFNGRVEATELQLEKSYPVKLDEENPVQWFCYTPAQDITTLLVSQGNWDIQGEIYNAEGELLEGGGEGEDTLSLRQSLEEGNTYYFKVKTGLYGGTKHFRICLKEVWEIQSLEIAESDMEEVYPENEYFETPSVLLKVTYRNGKSETLYSENADGHGNEFYGVVLDEEGNEIYEKLKKGIYSYQIRSMEEADITVSAGSFKVVSMDEFTDHAIAADGKEHTVSNQTQKMKCSTEIEEDGIYQIRANVPLDNLKLYDKDGNSISCREEANAYGWYAVLKQGTYVAIADLSRGNTELTLSVTKTVLPEKVTVYDRGINLIAGLESLSDDDMAVKVEYTDGTTTWIYGAGADQYGTRYKYSITDTSGKEWGMYETLPAGTYTVSAKVFRGSEEEQNSEENQMLNSVLTEGNKLSTIITVEELDLSQLSSVAENQTVNVDGKKEKYYYAFTPTEEGEYELSSENGNFYTWDGEKTEYIGEKVSANENTTYIVAVTVWDASSFQIVKAASTPEPEQKTVQKLELKSDTDYILDRENSLYVDCAKVYLLLTYEDATTKQIGLWDMENGEANMGEDGYGNRFTVYLEEVKKEDGIYQKVTVTYEEDITSIELPLKPVEELAAEVQTDTPVSAEEVQYFKFTAPDSGEYLLSVESKNEMLNLWQVGSKLSFYDVEIIGDGESRNYFYHAHMSKGQTYYFYVGYYDDEEQQEKQYTLTVRKNEKRIKGLRIITIPDAVAAWKGLGVENYTGIQAEVTYTDDSTEIISAGEETVDGRILYISDSYWLNRDTYRIVVECGEYLAYKDIPSTEWQYDGKLETDTDTVVNEDKNLLRYSFIPLESGMYDFNIDEDVCDIEIYDAESAFHLRSTGRAHRVQLEEGRKYNVAIYFYNPAEGKQCRIRPERDEVTEEHRYAEDRKEPTCTEAGYTQQKCTICGKILEDSYRELQPTGHDLTETAAREATCTEDGTQGYWRCQTCGKIFEDEAATKETTIAKRRIDAYGHFYDTMQWIEEKEPTCTEPGNVGYWHCPTCEWEFDLMGTTYLEMEPGTHTIPPLEHNWGEPVRVEPTCTEEGSITKTCERCGETDVTQLDMVEHDVHLVEEKEATCTEEGIRAHWICDVCGQIFADEDGKQTITLEEWKIGKKEHQWEEKILEEATDEAEGSSAMVCTVCEQIKENSRKVIPRKGHAYELVTDAVSWTEAVVRAQEAGGHLATVTTAAESTYIRQLLQDAGVSDCWLGGYLNQNQWRWITRESFMYSGFAGATDAVRSYLVENTDGIWFNAENTEKHGFVIEKEETIYEPDTTPPEIERVSPENHSVLSQTVEFSVAASDDTAVKSIQMEWAGEEEDAKWQSLEQVIYGEAGTFSVDTAVMPEGAVKVRFLAEDIYGNHAYSTAVYDYTVDNQGPEKVTGLSYTATASTITLSWSDVSDEDFSYFQVEQQMEDGTWTAVQTTSSTLGVNITGLSPEEKGIYRVVAYDLYGNRGEVSDAIEACTTKDITAPVISSISPEAMSCKGKIPMQFTVSDDIGIATLKIQISTDQKNWTEIAEIEVQKRQRNISVSYELDTDMLEEGSVFVRAIPTNLYGNEGNSSETAPFVEYVVDRTAPDVPQGLTAVVKGKKVRLSWKQGAEQDLAGYTVVRRDLETEEETVLVSDLRAVGFTDQTVEFSRSYAYRIRVADLAGNESDDSEAVEVTIPVDNEKPVIHSVAPSNGVIGVKNQIRALVEDNDEVESIQVSYSTDGQSWQNLPDIAVNAKSGVYEIKMNWDEIELGTEKQLYLKAVCVDVSGNVSSEVSRTYSVDNIAPEVSDLTATANEKCIGLQWRSANESDLAGFYLYRRAAGEAKENSICVLQKSAQDKEWCTFDDQSVQSLITYIYYVRAIDKYGNYADSDEVMIAAPLIEIEDVTDPHAYISANTRGAAGTEMVFSAASSYDDVGIVSYQWDFGDHTTADTVETTHVYETEGTYEVSLTVADAAGNKHTETTTVSIYDPENTGFVRVRVHDENGTPVSGAGVYFNLGSEDMRMINTDEDGYAQLSATKGMYPVGAYKDGYLPVKKEVQVTEKQTAEVSMTLVKKEIVIGDLTVKRMTLEEIKAAGIDLADEANQNVFQFKTTLYYKGEEIPLEATYNGEIWNFEEKEIEVDDRKLEINWIPLPPGMGSGAGWGSSGGGIGGSGGFGEIKEPMIAVLEIPGEGSWLKDFFDVELTVLNQADKEFYIDNCKANLKVPSGLTLMDSNYTTSSPEVSMGTIQGGKSATAHWILRGDEAGEYEISADFSGTLRDFGADVNATFKVKEPFEVRGGENIWVDIITESAILKYTDGAIRVGIRNEDENPIYCPQLQLFGVNFVKSWKADGNTVLNTSREVLENGEELWYDYIIDRDDWEMLIENEKSDFYLFKQITEQLSGAEVNFTMKTVEPLTISPDKIQVFYYNKETKETGDEANLLDLKKQILSGAKVPDLLIKTYRQDEYGKDIPTGMDVTILDGYRMKEKGEKAQKITTDSNGEYILDGYDITNWLPGLKDGTADDDRKLNYKAYDIVFYSSRAMKTISVVARGATSVTGNLKVTVCVEKENGKIAKVSGATVTLGEVSEVTGKKGEVTIWGENAPIGKNKIRICADGYYPLEDMVTIGEKTEKTYYLTKDDGLGHSYIKNLNCGLQSNSLGNVTVIPKGTATGKVTFTLDKQMENGEEFVSYMYRIADKKTEKEGEFTSNTFLLDLEDIDAGQKLYFGMKVKTGDGQIYQVPYRDAHFLVIRKPNFLNNFTYNLNQKTDNKVWSLDGKDVLKVLFSGDKGGTKVNLGNGTKDSSTDSKENAILHLLHQYDFEVDEEKQFPVIASYDTSGKVTITITPLQGSAEKQSGFYAFTNKKEDKDLERTSISGDMKIELTFTYNTIKDVWDVTVNLIFEGGVSVPLIKGEWALAYAEADFEGEGVLNLQMCKTDIGDQFLENLSDSFALNEGSIAGTVKASVGGKVGMKELASLGAYFKAGLKFGFMPYWKVLQSVEIGWEGHLLCFKREGALIKEDFEVVSGSGTSSHAMDEEYRVLSEEDGLLSVVEEAQGEEAGYTMDVASANSQWKGQDWEENKGSGTLATGVYYDVQQQTVVLPDGTTLMVFANYTEDKNNPIGIYYTRKTGDAWSEPKRVSTDGTIEMDPHLTRTNTGASLIWTKLNEKLPDMSGSYTEEQIADIFADKMVICQAYYDPESDIWTSQKIAAGTAYVGKPVWASDGENSLSVWVENAAGAETATADKPDTLHFSYRKGETVAQSGEIQIPGYQVGDLSLEESEGNYLLTARITNTENKVEIVYSSYDGEKWKKAETISSDREVFSPKYIKGKLYYISDEKILCAENGKVRQIVYSSSLEHVEDFSAADYGEKGIVLAWSEYKYDGSIYMAVSQDGVKWSEPIEAVQQAGLCAAPQISLTNEEIMLIYQEAITDKGIRYELKTTSVTSGTDLKVTESSTDGMLYAGADMKTNFKVANVGADTVNSVTAVISENQDGSNPVAKTTVRNGLNGSIIWKVPDAYQGNTYYLIILPSDEAVKDSDMSNNVADIGCQMRDVAITYGSYMGTTQEGAQLLIGLENQGIVSTGGMSLKAENLENGELLYEGSLSEMSGGDERDVSFQIDKTLENSSILVTVTCEEEETNIENNTEIIRINEIVDMDDTIQAHIHTWDDGKVTLEPTCTASGEKTYDCTFEGCTESRTEVIPAGHMEVTDEAVEPTCTKNGLTEGSHCSRCGEVLKAQKTINAPGHQSVTDEAVEPTCTKNGLTEGSHCSRCGEVLQAQKIIPAPGHDYGEWKTIKEPDCEETGTAERYCIKCQNRETKEINRLGHSWKQDVLEEATESREGVQRLICERCKTEKENSRTVIPKTTHTMGAWKVEKTATCAEKGLEKRVCIYENCTLCKKDSRYEETRSIPATGVHQFGAWTTTIAATALADGVKTRTCSVCKKTETQSIPKLQATIRVTATQVTVKTGDTVDLSKYVTGLALGDSVASYTSSNSKIASVNSAGKVTGIAAGTAKITIGLASKGATAEITVTVQKKQIATKSIKGLSKTLKLQVKATKQLKPVITPANSTDKLTYATSDKKIVTVSSKGKVTAKKAGKAKITVQSGKKKFVITVTVTVPTPTGMKNVPGSVNLKKGKTYTLKPTLLPSGATGKITYKTSNKKVATVDAKGKIKATGKGKATITVTVGKIKKTCKVTVK